MPVNAPAPMFHTRAPVPEKLQHACPPVEADVAINACSCARCDVITPPGDVVYGVHLRSETFPAKAGSVAEAANGLPRHPVTLTLCKGCADKQLDANRRAVQGWLREQGWTG